METIAAVATPSGRGGVGIVRVSGPLAGQIARATVGHLPVPRAAEYLAFLDTQNRVIDRGIALYFPAPHSFTGEDILELQGHGGPVVMDLLLQQVVGLGARIARPGEFSERAFLNGKLDLVQAEAIADLISCNSEQALRGALQTFHGEFSKQVGALVQRLIELRSYVESAIDFPTDEIDFLDDERVTEKLDRIEKRLASIRQSAQQGALLRDGMQIAIVGQPNAGKSSLINLLARKNLAIVTEIPGTTRDALHEQINIDGLPLHVVDTAGLRESDDVVERHGIARTLDEIQRADHILLVVEERAGFSKATREIARGFPSDTSVTVIRNKIDLFETVSPRFEQGELGSEIYMSAKSGDGLALLQNHLKKCVGYNDGSEGQFMARRRHLTLLEQAAHHLSSGREVLSSTVAGELLAEDLRLAQNSLSEITGEYTPDDLLGDIFSTFCIGK
ncbi:MAG: tRNA uridine-5-carboxymethylaminomethyl(34) synthesis GTPase MnmE [Gammaproteobacteria bacterium]|nr:tRNA uridine-5-carboxymethylaminomethyl(34) synthesis GTPase MnmE [Gammaproteobacteria bacterium]